MDRRKYGWLHSRRLEYTPQFSRTGDTVEGESEEERRNKNKMVKKEEKKMSE